MKTKKTIGNMTYGEFMKESVKFTAKIYAIAGICFGIFCIINNKPVLVKPKTDISEDISENITEDVTED